MIKELTHAMSFPLYDSLIVQPRKKALGREEKLALLRSIDALDERGQRTILALILHYQRLHNIKPYLTPAPAMKILLNTLPGELQILLSAFCARHLDYMKDTEGRTNLER